MATASEGVTPGSPVIAHTAQPSVPRDGKMANLFLQCSGIFMTTASEGVTPGSPVIAHTAQPSVPRDGKMANLFLQCSESLWLRPLRA
jgi:hypothetical protein